MAKLPHVPNEKSIYELEDPRKFVEKSKLPVPVYCFFQATFVPIYFVTLTKNVGFILY